LGVHFAVVFDLGLKLLFEVNLGAEWEFGAGGSELFPSFSSLPSFKSVTEKAGGGGVMSLLPSFSSLPSIKAESWEVELSAV
jgi:hypothetical protein